MKKAVLFDLDGTLLMTHPDLLVAMNKMLKDFNFPLTTEENVKRAIGYGAVEFVKRSIPEEHWDKAKECHSVYSRHYSEGGSPLTCLYDGIDGLLKALIEKGIKLAIISNKPQKATDEVYQKYLSKYNFDYIYGFREGFEAKPSAQPTLFALKEMGINKEDAVFVGDGETDILTAINGGIDSIGVLWGYRSKEQLEAAGGKLFANTASELLNLILSFNDEGK